MADSAASTGQSGGAFDWLVQMIQHIVSQQSGGSATPPVVVPPAPTNDQPKAAKTDAKPAPAAQQPQQLAQATPALYSQIQPLASIVPTQMQGMPMMQPMGMQPAPNLIGPQPKTSTGGGSPQSGAGKAIQSGVDDLIAKAGSALGSLLGL